MRPRVVCLDLEVLLDSNERSRISAYLSDLPEENVRLNTDSRIFLDELKNNACNLCLISGGGNRIKQVVGSFGLDKWFSSDNINMFFNYDEESYSYYEDKFPGCKYYFIADVKRDFQIPNQLGWTTCGLVDIMDDKTPLSRGDGDNMSYCRVNRCHLKSFQDMIIPQRTDFVVPIMEDTKSEETQQGTGFILDQYLITAAHVFYNLNIGDKRCEELKYKFDDREFSIKLREALFDGHKYECRKGFSQDLLVFRVNHKGSPFVLNTDGLKDDMVFESCAYHYDKHKDEMDFRFFKNVRIFDKKFHKINYFEVIGEHGSPFKKGNSGCPLYNENIVYGVLWKIIGRPSLQYDELFDFVDARYISEMLQM